MPICLLQVHHGFEQGSHFSFPLLVHAPLLALISQIVKDSIDSLRLFANAMYHIGIGWYALGDVHVFLEISLGSESVFKPTVEDGLPHPDELRVTCLFSILKTVEGIEQHTPTEAQLHMIYWFAVIAPDAYAGMVFERIFVNVSHFEIVGQLCLHLFGRIKRLHGFRLQTVETVVPGVGNILPVVGRLTFMNKPCESDLLTFLKFGESADGIDEGEFADVSLGCFHKRISERYFCLTGLIVKAQISHRAFTT